MFKPSKVEIILAGTLIALITGTILTTRYYEEYAPVSLEKRIIEAEGTYNKAVLWAKEEAATSEKAR